jgi:hypothetical protein
MTQRELSRLRDPSRRRGRQPAPRDTVSNIIPKLKTETPRYRTDMKLVSRADNPHRWSDKKALPALAPDNWRNRPVQV